MKLISMTDYVLERKLKIENDAQNHIVFSTSGNLSKIFRYANFLQQPLELGMFIPVDEDGSVLKEPEYYDLWKMGIAPNDSQDEICFKYQKAKEKILFDGFEIRDKGNFYFIEEKKSCLYYRVLKNNSKATIENLLVFNETILTESAIKQLGL